MLLFDLSRFFFGSSQNVDCLFVLQDILVAGEDLQDLLLDFEEFFLVGCPFKNQPLFFLLEVGSFLLDDDSQQLIVESFVGDHEVDDGDLGGDLGQIVRVPVLGGDVE